MRVESDKPVSNGGWIHALAEPLPERILPEKKQQPVVNWDQRQHELYRGMNAKAMRQQLSAKLGVSEDSLEALGIGCGFDKGGAFSSWPERLHRKILGISRRYGSGEKKLIYGGRHGLYFADDWEKPQTKVFLPEGGSDTAALITMNISAIGRPSNLGGVKHLSIMLRHVRKPIVVLGENDTRPSDKCGTCGKCGLCAPGRHGAETTAKRLSEALGRKVSWCLPEAKDVREWLKNQEGDARELRQKFLHSLHAPP